MGGFLGGFRAVFGVGIRRVFGGNFFRFSSRVGSSIRIDQFYIGELLNRRCCVFEMLINFDTFITRLMVKMAEIAIRFLYGVYYW